MAKSRTRRRRTTARAFHYATRSGHILATTLWIALLATGIALQFFWGIVLGIAEGVQQLRHAWKTRHHNAQEPPQHAPSPHKTHMLTFNRKRSAVRRF